MAGAPDPLRARLLEAAERLVAEHGHVVWLGSPDGDPGLSEALAVALPEDDPPALELLVGSWDTTGARLLEQTMMKRPGYPEYAARTSMFVPWPPKA